MTVSATERYDSLFQKYGQERGVDWRLLKAQAIAESALNKDARSKVGAEGLCQFMPATWQELCKRHGRPEADARDPEDAIWGQSIEMAWLLDQAQRDVSLALAAYNWGIGNVSRVFLKPRLAYDSALVPGETRAYVAKILTIAKSLAPGAFQF